MSMQGCKPHEFSSGSALVEFAILLVVLLPIGFGMAMLGKLTDMKQTAEQASRYSAWEATVYSRQAMQAQQASTVEQRFFSSPDAPIRSHAGDTSAIDQQNHTTQNPLWGSSTVRRGSLPDLGTVALLQNSPVRPHYVFDTGKASAALLTGKVAARAGQPLARFKGNRWGIVADGLVRSNIDVPVQSTGFLPGSTGACGRSSQIANNSTPDSGQDKSVCVSSAGVILADGWGASGDAVVVSRVRSLVPASALSSVGKGVGRLLGSVLFPELEPLDKAFGHVDMRVLPRYARP